MNSLKLKNAEKLNACIKCGMLTWNGKKSLCNGCRPGFKRSCPNPSLSNQKKSKKIHFPPEPKRPGKQLFEVENIHGKTIERTEFKYGNLIITFTDQTYLELRGNNQGNGGYIEIGLSRAERTRREKLFNYGYICRNCRHRWLPRNRNLEPSKCPTCRNTDVVTIFSATTTIYLNELE